MTANHSIIHESRDGTSIITIDRPRKLNALNVDVAEGLCAAWNRFNESDDRVAILTGTGDRAFSAGVDFDNPPEMWRLIPGVGARVEKPIIAAVDGWCIGGGVVLVQFCDLCIATDRARFSYPEAKVGFSGGLIASLVTRIPHKVAMEFILLGEELSAARAYEIGFVNKVVSPKQLLDTAFEYAEKLKSNAPLVISMLKRFTAMTLPKGPIEYSGIGRRDVDLVLMQSEDLKEGIKAFKEKRAPNFTGR